MRKQILGATAAILGASVLSIGLPSAPTHGAAWLTTHQIPFPAGTVTDVDVVSTGPGDAVAAAIINGAVHAFTAVDGVWVGHDQVRGDVDAEGLVLAANGKGDAAVGWEEVVSGDNRLRASRQVSPTSWTGLQLLTPAGADIAGNADLGIAGNGLVIATATVNGDEATNKLFATEWWEGQAPLPPKVISASHSWGPSLDVNTKGEALLAYTYSGLNTDVVTVSRRTPGQGWSIGDSTSNTGDVAAPPEVALSDNGQGQVIYSDIQNGFYVAQTSRVLADGTALPDQTVGPVDEYVYETSVDINATGSALFTWISKKNMLTRVFSASAANGAYPGTPSPLTGATTNAVDPTARISDSGLRVVQHSGDGQVVTHTRTGGIQPFVPVYSGNGFHTDDAVDVDREGNAISVAFKPAGGIIGKFFDAAGPTVAIDALPANMLENPPLPMTVFPISWTMADSLSTIPRSDIYATRAAWNEAGHSAPEVLVNDAPGTEADVPWKLGTSYCLQVRSTDAAGNSTTSSPSCTTVPLDDRGLVGDGWNKVTQSGNFRNTLLTTNKQGRTLTRTGVKAKRLALVVRKTDGGGTVRVTFAGETLGSYSLDGIGKKKVVNLAAFPTVRSGTLTIKVTSPDGELVSIDGLVAAK